MKRYKIMWRPATARQLDCIADYISIFSPAAARKIVKSIRNSVKQLEKNPFIGQREELLIKLKMDYRYIVDGNYKVIYRFDKNTVYVIAIFDTRRNPKSLEKVISSQ
jgi:toxin ParE1/3/4